MDDGASAEFGATAWANAFTEGSASAFANGFADDVRLEATSLVRPVLGRDQVATVLEEASRSYSDLEFVVHVDAGRHHFVSWRATTWSGLEMEGVTVLEHNDQGAIISAAIHHRPLKAMLQFSQELGDRLAGRIDRDCFWPDRS